MEKIIKYKLLIYIALSSLLTNLLPFSSHAEFKLMERHNGFHIYENDRVDGEQSIVLLKNSQPIYTITGNSLSYTIYDKTSKLLGSDKDVIVIHDYTGGAHCCNIYYLVEFANKDPKVVFKNSMDYQLEIIKNDKDKTYKIKSYDPVYSYFYTSFADSYAPEVILKFNGEKLDLDTNEMKRIISKDDYEKRINALEASLSKDPQFIDFIKEAISFIYSGNASYALKMIDEVFPKYKFNDLALEEFKQALLCKIKRSRYVKGLTKMNEPFLNLRKTCEKEKNNPFSL